MHPAEDAPLSPDEPTKDIDERAEQAKAEATLWRVITNGRRSLRTVLWLTGCWFGVPIAALGVEHGNALVTTGGWAICASGSLIAARMRAIEERARRAFEAFACRNRVSAAEILARLCKSPSVYGEDRSILLSVLDDLYYLFNRHVPSEKP